jgi:hypothetical protein
VSFEGAGRLLWVMPSRRRQSCRSGTLRIRRAARELINDCSDQRSSAYGSSRTIAHVPVGRQLGHLQRRPTRAAASTATSDTRSPKAIMAAFRTRTDVGTGRASRGGPDRRAAGRGSAIAAATGAGGMDAARGRWSHVSGTAWVRNVTPGTGSGSPQGAVIDVIWAPTGTATRRDDAGGASPMIQRIAVSTGTATTRRPDAGRTSTARSAAERAPARTRARRASLRGGLPGDQATGADGAITMRVARVRTRNNSYPRHVAERGTSKVLHLVAR